MPDAARTIVVSGGVEAAPPKTVGTIPRFVNVDPDVISDSIVRQDEVVSSRIVIGTDPSDAPTSSPVPILAMEGACYPAAPGIDDSILIGRNVEIVAGSAPQQILIATFGGSIDAAGAVGNTNNVVIGIDVSAKDSGLIGMLGNVIVGVSCAVVDQASANVLIGRSHVADGQDANQVRIGNTSTMSSANLSSVVGIGNGTTIGFRGVSIGDRASSSGGDAIAIGQENPQATGAQAIAIGRAVRARALDGICIGALANNANASDRSGIAIGVNAQTVKANQMVVGGIGLGNINEVVIGAGDSPNQSPTFPLLTIRTSNIPSAGVPNLAGAEIKIATGTGIGNAVGGAFIVEVPQAVASGTGVQTVTTGLQVLYSGTATETYLQIFDVDNGALGRVSVGAADSGGVGFKVLRIPN